MEIKDLEPESDSRSLTNYFALLSLKHILSLHLHPILESDTANHCDTYMPVL